MITTPICQHCTEGEPAEWLDEYCQVCWESHCSAQWWALGARLEESEDLIEFGFSPAPLSPGESAIKILTDMSIKSLFVRAISWLLSMF